VAEQGPEEEEGVGAREEEQGGDDALMALEGEWRKGESMARFLPAGGWTSRGR
jgi:hypothetical protein